MPVTLDEVTMAKSQKSRRVKLSGSWYGAYLDSKIETAPIGAFLEAEIVTLDKGGPWIKAWRLSQNAAPQVATASAAGSPPSPAAAAPKYAEPNINVAPWWMPFVSNTVAHAIQAGHVNNPAGIKAWALAAKESARALVSHAPATQDEDIPF